MRFSVRIILSDRIILQQTVRHSQNGTDSERTKCTLKNFEDNYNGSNELDATGCDNTTTSTQW